MGVGTAVIGDLGANRCWYSTGSVRRSLWGSLLRGRQLLGVATVFRRCPALAVGRCYGPSELSRTHHLWDLDRFDFKTLLDLCAAAIVPMMSRVLQRANNVIAANTGINDRYLVAVDRMQTTRQ